MKRKKIQDGLYWFRLTVKEKSTAWRSSFIFLDHPPQTQPLCVNWLTSPALFSPLAVLWSADEVITEFDKETFDGRKVNRSSDYSSWPCLSLCHVMFYSGAASRDWMNTIVCLCVRECVCACICMWGGQEIEGEIDWVKLGFLLAVARMVTPLCQFTAGFP